MEEKKEVTLEDAYNMVISHMKQENYRVAEMVINDILQAHPDNYETHYMKGLCRYYVGDVHGALASIKASLDSGEAEAEWWCNYGIMLTETNVYEAAIKAFDKAIEIDPQYDNSYWNKAHAYWLSEQYEEAEKAARASLEINDQTQEAWLNLGTSLVRQGKAEEATEAWQRALEINPDYAFAWSNLGNVLRETGKIKEAEEACRKALEIDENYPDAYNNLGNALLDQGLIQEAEDAYKKAVASKPDFAPGHNNLAIAYLQQHRYEDAIAHARYAISYDKVYYEAYLNLSLAQRALGHMDAAEKSIQQAIIIKPESAEVHIDMADLLFMRDRYAEAEIELKKAQELEPDSPRLYIKLSNVLERGNKVEEALLAVDKAVELNPEMPDAYLRKGNIYHISNNPKEAKECFEKVLELQPEMITPRVALAELYQSLGELEESEREIDIVREKGKDLPGFYLTLSKLKKFTEDDEDFKHMVGLSKDMDSLGIEQASMLNFALFSAYENIGDYPKAFEHLKEGNTLKRKMIPYEPEKQQDTFDKIKENFTKEMVEGFKGKGFKSDLPVFILGMPRSGTTLTEQIISSHADVYGAGELSELGMVDAEHGPLNQENAIKKGQRYVEEVMKKADGEYLRITDKMPGNFSNIGRILCTLPDASIIHTKRNPMDTCLSCFKQNFARGQYWSYDLDELGDFYNMYLDLMEHWRTEFPDVMLEIQYEETVSDLEPRAKAMIDYIGLPWDEACLEPHKQKRAVLTASKMQVIKPVYKTSMAAWKRYENELEPLLESLSKGAAKALI